MLEIVLTMVQNAGFIVVVVICDNDQVNAKMFQSIYVAHHHLKRA